MSSKLFMQVLFEEEIQPNDIQVISEPDADHPGQARLNLAIVGSPDPAAPSSLPLISQSRAKIGFVANVEFLEAPYEGSYVIK